MGEVAYSVDGKQWQGMGGSFKLGYDWRTGTFQGQQFALFCYNPKPGAGELEAVHVEVARAEAPPA